MLAMRNDVALRDKFFSRVKMLFYAGAGLSQPVWDAFDAMAVASTGSRILWVTGLGATETAPTVTFTAWDGVRSGHIGLPVPGVEVKLVPVDDKLEIRARGPNITPGYWREPALTQAAFDEEGFYRLGDGVRFIDPIDPNLGLVFDGRIAEDFKLSSGTWVNTGPLRAKFIAAGAPYVQDVVLAGLNRDVLCALLLPNVEACRALASGLAADATLAQLVAHPAVRDCFQAVLDRMAGVATGSSTLIRRAMVLDTPPSIDLGEITDKGSINQRAVLAHRAALVEALYTEPYPAQVLIAKHAS
jgi:feruloyl-CoA synthase